MRIEFQQCHVADDSGQIDRRFDARIAAADHRDALAFEQRTVAMRTVGDAAIAVLALTGHIDLAPAGTRRDDDRPRPQRTAAREAQFDQFAGNQSLGSLRIHDVDVVDLDVLIEPGCQPPSVGLLDRDEILYRDRIQQLSAEPLGDDAGAYPLAGRVDGRRRPRGPAADDEHVEGRSCAKFGRLQPWCVGVEFREDFLYSHSPMAERFAVQKYGRNRHDAPAFGFILECGAIDHRVPYVRIHRGHQVQRLDDIRTILALERNERFEAQRLLRTAQAEHLLEQFGGDLGRVAADVQQRQHERRKLMAHRQSCEPDARVHAVLAQSERRLQLGVVAALLDRDECRSGGDGGQQFDHLPRTLAVVHRCDDLHRTNKAREVALQLLDQIGVQHSRFTIRRIKRFELRRRPDQILPTKSSDGAIVLAPGVHFAGQTSPGCAATYCAA